MHDWQTIHRPWPVTIVLWSVFFFVIGYASQAYAIGAQLSFLLRFDNLLDPRWRVVTAVLWALIWAGMWIALRWKRPFVRYAIPFLFFANIIASFFGQGAPTPFLALRRLGIVIILLFSTWSLHNWRAKQYFTEGDFKIGH